MRIAFRQGLITFQKDAGNPVFLQPSTVNGFVDHIVSPTVTTVAFAHGSSDYLQSFDNTVAAAWGPLTPGVDNYLYFDIDLLTADVSRGITTLIPVNSLVAPSSPADGQHWFDLASTTMKVWSTARNKWQPKIRVFAARVVNGSTNSIVMYDEGSQVGLNTPSNPGYIMLDSQLQPLRKSTGEFLTDDTAVHVRSTVGTSGVLVQPVNRIVPIRAGEDIPAMSLVYISAPDTVRLASSNPSLIPSRVPVGVVVDAIASGDVGTLTSFGEITWDMWPLQPGPLGANFAANAGAPLYCGNNGEITLVRPAGLLAYRVGFVKNATTIMFSVDAETFPQVYQADVDSLVITGTPPIAVADVINGLGERIVTVSATLSSSSASGLMSSAQFNQLVDHDNRLDVAEQDINDLEINKANVVHTHVIANVTGLQSALDVLTTALTTKTDKVAGATVGNFAGLNVSGNLTDSGYGPTAFSLVGHTHTIPDVTGLQTALNNKSNRAHINSFAEVFQGVDRTGPTDVATGLDLNAVLLTKSDVGHTHIIANVTGLQTALDNRSLVGHTHAIPDVSGLQTALDGKSDVGHTHVIANVSGLQAALDAKSDVGHVHAIANVTGLQAALDAKSDVGHIHAIANVTGLQTELDNRALVSHTHSPSAIVGGTSGQVLVSNGTNGTWATLPASAPDYQQFVATAGQTVLNTTLNTVGVGGGKARLQVFLNGVFQMEGASKAYTVTGPNQITFNAGLTLNDDIVVYAFA